MKIQEKEERQRSRGLAKASPVGDPPLTQATRNKSRPLAPHSVTAKSEAAIQSVDPMLKARTKFGPVSQSSAMAAVMVLSYIPKAKGANVVEHSCIAQYEIRGDGAP